MSLALLTAIGGLLSAFSPPLTALIQGLFASHPPADSAGRPEREHRPWMVPVAMGAWIIAIALSVALFIAALAASTPIMSNPLVTGSRVAIGLVALVAVSSGATGIAFGLRRSAAERGDSEHQRPDIVRGACYLVGGLIVIAGMAVVA